MHKMDCQRLGKNFAFMARCLKETDSDELMSTAGEAVLEHHFNEHKCFGKWCPELHPKGDAKRDQCHRDKKNETDAKLCAKIETVIAQFMALETLKEVAHGNDMCANKSFSDTIAWVAPKNEVHCGSNSLAN